MMLELPFLRSESDSDNPPSILMTQKRQKFRRKSPVKRTAQEMEEIRYRAIELIEEKGLNYSQAAKILEVSRAAVSNWYLKYLQHGDRGIQRVQRRLKSDILSFFPTELVMRLESGATKLGYSDDRWITERLMELFRRTTGSEPNPTKLKRTMNRLGYDYDWQLKCWMVNLTKQSQALESFKHRRWMLDD